MFSFCFITYVMANIVSIIIDVVYCCPLYIIYIIFRTLIKKEVVSRDSEV